MTAILTSNATEPPVSPWRHVSSRAAHPSATVATEPLIASIARGLASASAPWDPDDPGAERSYQLLLQTDLYDAWLIHWPPGTGLEAHDHGGSSGAFAVVSGTLDEVFHTIGGDVGRHVNEGDVVWFDERHVHTVANSGVRGATSVHVYSPPLSTMAFYEPDESGALAMDRIDDIDTARQ